ncbi:CD209 antigen-like protein C [Kryptolebias marmoratus]|uniref:CD209 antigen-like protein C n=1 Tax=Kryptolebias marmoratus TaxID=37003 RepID=UPI0018ACB294|nr:CD209 antigen-like protein C [Kryptolebias marmoratus]
METSQRHPEDEKGDRDAGGRSCEKRRLTAVGAAVALAAGTLVTALVLNFVLSAATQSPEPKEEQTSETFGEDQQEELLQCRRENHELKLLLRSVTRDPRCHLCPAGWLWWRSRCYFFSVARQEDLRWNESAAFCQRHNSSLVVIEDFAEMDFLQGVMSEYPRFPFLWVALTDSHEEGRWLWGDGTEVQHHLPSVSVEWDAEDRDCADLRGRGSLFAAACDVYGPWACKKRS